MAKAYDTGLIERDPLAWLDGGNDGVFPLGVGTPLESLTDIGVELGEGEADSTHMARVELAVSPNLADVGQLHGQLKEALDGHQAIEIDASNVESIDTSTLQLLLILRVEAAKLHKTVVFKAPSKSFVRSAKLLDLDDLMGLE